MVFAQINHHRGTEDSKVAQRKTEIRPLAYGSIELSNAHTFISEILFADDPRLTSDVRERSLREGLVIFPVTRATNGEWRVQGDFQIR